jgi:hypothetical protein
MTIKTHIELEVEVAFDYVKEERETRNCPGSPESIEITYVTILQNGAELTLTPQQSYQVETDVWAALEKMRKEPVEP